MARAFGATVSYRTDGTALDIHVYGDMLPCSVHTELIDIIKENRGKSINFIVDYPSMLLQIRESIPKEFYNDLSVKKTA